MWHWRVAPPSPAVLVLGSGSGRQPGANAGRGPVSGYRRPRRFRPIRVCPCCISLQSWALDGRAQAGKGESQLLVLDLRQSGGDAGGGLRIEG